MMDKIKMEMMDKMMKDMAGGEGGGMMKEMMDKMMKDIMAGGNGDEIKKEMKDKMMEMMMGSFKPPKPYDHSKIPDGFKRIKLVFTMMKHEKASKDITSDMLLPIAKKEVPLVSKR